jgi:hypothetical protein
MNGAPGRGGGAAGPRFHPYSPAPAAPAPAIPGVFPMGVGRGVFPVPAVRRPPPPMPPPPAVPGAVAWPGRMGVAGMAMMMPNGVPFLPLGRPPAPAAPAPAPPAATVVDTYEEDMKYMLQLEAEEQAALAARPSEPELNSAALYHSLKSSVVA